MQSSTRSQTISLLIGIAIVGVGIGWLVGMSLSPVIANITATIVTAAAAIVAAVSGLENKNGANTESAPAVSGQQPLNTNTNPQSRTAQAITAVGRLQVNPWPLAALLVGLFLGTTAGNYIRVNDSLRNPVVPLSPLTTAELKSEIDPWVTQGMSQTFVLSRLFDLRYPTDATVSTLATTPSVTSSTGLYAFGTDAGQDACDQISRTSNDDLEELLLGELTEGGTRQGGLQNEVLAKLFVELDNPQSFRIVGRILCDSAQ